MRSVNRKRLAVIRRKMYEVRKHREETSVGHVVWVQKAALTRYYKKDDTLLTLKADPEHPYFVGDLIHFEILDIPEGDMPWAAGVDGVTNLFQAVEVLYGGSDSRKAVGIKEGYVLLRIQKDIRPLKNPSWRGGYENPAVRELFVEEDPYVRKMKELKAICFCLMGETPGERIMLYRKNAGMNVHELAEMLGVADVQLEGWEDDSSDIPAYVMPMLSDIFGCSIDELLTGKEYGSGDETDGIEDDEEEASLPVYPLHKSTARRTIPSRMNKRDGAKIRRRPFLKAPQPAGEAADPEGVCSPSKEMADAEGKTVKEADGLFSNLQKISNLQEMLQTDTEDNAPV